MKTWLLSMILSRAAPKLVQYGVKVIQNGAVAVSAYLGGHGFVVGDNVTMIAGGLAGLFAVSVDFARTHYAGKL